MNVKFIEEPYAVSYEEKEAIEAASKGDYKQAVIWYDRAILSDPSRIIRVFDQCRVSNTKILSRYSPMASAFLERNETEVKAWLKAMAKRSSIPPVNPDTLIKDMFLLSYTDAVAISDPSHESVHEGSSLPPPRWSDGSSVAHEQQRLDEKKNE